MSDEKVINVTDEAGVTYTSAQIIANDVACNDVSVIRDRFDECASSEDLAVVNKKICSEISSSTDTISEKLKQLALADDRDHASITDTILTKIKESDDVRSKEVKNLENSLIMYLREATITHNSRSKENMPYVSKKIREYSIEQAVKFTSIASIVSNIFTLVQLAGAGIFLNSIAHKISSVYDTPTFTKWTIASISIIIVAWLLKAIMYNQIYELLQKKCSLYALSLHNMYIDDLGKMSLEDKKLITNEVLRELAEDYNFTSIH